MSVVLSLNVMIEKDKKYFDGLLRPEKKFGKC